MLPQATQPKLGYASPSHKPQPHTTYTRLVPAPRGQCHHTETWGTEHPDTATRTTSNLLEVATTLFSLSYSTCHLEAGRTIPHWLNVEPYALKHKASYPTKRHRLIGS